MDDSIMPGVAPDTDSGRRKKPYEVVLICPVLDDWDNLAQLLPALAAVFAPTDIALHAVIIDDGSSRRWDWEMLKIPPGQALASIEVIRLVINLGHQRAIAVGLVEACVRPTADAILIMDGDGEDRPEEAVRLIAEMRAAPETIALAMRAERSETKLFKAFYWAYKIAFRTLTGRPIRFGNFSAMPKAAAWQLAHMPELWNNLPAAILRSRLPVSLLPTARGRRYTGRSRMSPVSLIAHGLGAMSVYADVVLTRVLIGTGLLGSLTILGIVLTLIIRFLTDLAIPGWATTVVGILVVVLIQALLLAGVATFQSLAMRSMRPIIPLTDSGIFILGRDRRTAPTFADDAS